MDRPDEEREAAPMWIREKAVLAPDLLGRGEALEKVSELDLVAEKPCNHRQNSLKLAIN